MTNRLAKRIVVATAAVAAAVAIAAPAVLSQTHVTLASGAHVDVVSPSRVTHAVTDALPSKPLLTH